MPVAAQLAVAWATVFLINLVPAFMPPTWSVLAFFLIQFDLPLLPLSIGGALAATAGRLALALGARALGPRVLPAATIENLTCLGEYLRRHRKWIGLAVLVYSFGPIPSNQLFMAAGLARLDLRVVAGAFLVGRLVSYTTFTHVADRVVGSAEDLFLHTFTDAPALLLELVSLGTLVAIAQIPWRRLLPSRAGTPPPGPTDPV
jgi:hypothetical protein